VGSPAALTQNLIVDLDHVDVVLSWSISFINHGAVMP
jgi:hypothetical protein